MDHRPQPAGQIQAAAWFQTAWDLSVVFIFKGSNTNNKEEHVMSTFRGWRGLHFHSWAPCTGGRNCRGMSTAACTRGLCRTGVLFLGLQAHAWVEAGAFGPYSDPLQSAQSGLHSSQLPKWERDHVSKHSPPNWS